MASLIGLEVTDVMRLKAVKLEINQEGLTIIEGSNRQGKSSLAAALFALMGGRQALPQQPIRQGAKKGKVVGHLVDCLEFGELVATLTIRESGTTDLTITTKDGAKVNSPQTILNRLRGVLGFNPLSFLDLKPAEQAAKLQELVPGLSTADLDSKHAELFEARTNLNREVKALAVRLEKMPHHEHAPSEPQSLVEASRQIQEAMDLNAENARKRKARQDAEAAHQKAIDTAEAKLEQIALLQKEITQAEDQERTLYQQMQKMDKALLGLKDADLEALRKHMSEIESLNDLARQNAERAKVQAELDAQTAQASALTTRIDQLREAKSKRLRDATYPVKGLELRDEGVYYEGLPLSQCSGAEGVRVSTAVALTGRGPDALPLMIVDDAEKLDAESLRMVAEEVTKLHGQAVMLMVGDGTRPGSIVIEDGMVKETKKAEPENPKPEPKPAAEEPKKSNADNPFEGW